MEGRELDLLLQAIKRLERTVESIGVDGPLGQTRPDLDLVCRQLQGGLKRVENLLAWIIVMLLTELAVLAILVLHR